MRREIIKNNKGITLIALVITIIILIILAGVSINLVFDEEGIIKRAKQAAENMEIAQVEEQEMLNTALNYIENQGKVVIEGPIDGGSYDNPYIPTGFTHTEGEGTWNSGYVIREKDTGNEFVWVPCVIDALKIKAGDSVEIFKKTTEGKYNANSFSLAPTDTGIVDEEPTETIRTSVGIYGGFYIAKYEAGVPLDENGNEIAVISATVTQKARSVAGAIAWTDISRANAIIAAENMINTTDGVKSGLISGEAWDTTLQWMVNTSDNAKNEPNAGYDLDSTGNGWYSDVSNNQKTITGQYPINNIYDMAGNVFEWTTENCIYNGSRDYFVLRGGDYGRLGSMSPAAYRYCIDGANNYMSFRVVLYK